MRRAAIIQISREILLEVLDFEEGIIHRVYTPDNYLMPNYFNVVIEHPDLPEVPDSEELPMIRPLMQSYYGKDGSPPKIERLDPPRQNGSVSA